MRGWIEVSYQRYECLRCATFWSDTPDRPFGEYTVEVVEFVVFAYLRTLSLNVGVSLLRAFYEQDILSKWQVLEFIERVADMLPSMEAVTAYFKPLRSGWYAWDGTWFKYRGHDFVLLVCFDVRTLDVVNSVLAPEEDAKAYKRLVNKVAAEISRNSKGFHADGDLGLLKVLSEHFPGVPIQVCSFHKYTRVGQVIAFHRPKHPLHAELKVLVERVLFATSEAKARQHLAALERFVEAHKANRKLRQVVEIVRYNFELLLTHFRHPEMSPYNNVLEGFNGLLKRRIQLMKGFKKPVNIHRYFKLFLLDYRFHPLVESKFPKRNGQSPLQLAGCKIPKHYNWIKLLRTTLPPHQPVS